VRETDIQNLKDANQQLRSDKQELREDIAKLRKAIASRKRRLASKRKAECRGQSLAPGSYELKKIRIAKTS
jgi:septal ring factor EnvC (AmiA/AmiB activator)